MVSVGPLFKDSVERYLQKQAKGDSRVEHLLNVALHDSLSQPDLFQAVHSDLYGTSTNVNIHPKDLQDIKDALNKKVDLVRRYIVRSIKADSEWVREHTPLPLSHYSNIDQAYDAAERGQKKLSKRFTEAAIGPTMDTEVEMTFKDGKKIRSLRGPHATFRAGKVLNNCAGNGMYDDREELFTLCEEDDTPILLLEVREGELVQCRSKHNAIPSVNEFSYVREFMGRRDLRLAPDPSSTGMVEHKGEIHSIYALPEAHRFTKSLQLKFSYDIPVFPEGTSIDGAYECRIKKNHMFAGMSFANAKNAMRLPEDFHAEKLIVTCYDGEQYDSAKTQPAYIVFDCKSQRATEMHWRKKGKFDRTGDEPAVITFDAETGKVTCRQWWDADKRHRWNAPAVIETHAKTGIVINEAWYFSGQRSRMDGPARIHRDAQTGKIAGLEWWLEGELIEKPHNHPKFMIPFQNWLMQIMKEQGTFVPSAVLPDIARNLFPGIDQI